MSECRALAVIPKTIKVIARVHPLRKSEEYTHDAPIGSSIQDIVGIDAAYSIQVFLNSDEINRDDWAITFPDVNDVVLIRRYPQGSKAGKYLSAIVGTVLLFVPGFQALGVGLLVSTGISAVASLLIPKPKTPTATPATTSLLSITGTSNQATPFGAVPIPLGSVSFFPPHAANPYTEILGDDQYLYCLLDLGYGNLTVGDVTVGNTLLEDLEDVNYEIGTSPSIFTNDIQETQLNLEMDTDGTSNQATLAEACDAYSFDIYFPSGLFGVDNQGNLVGATFHFTVFEEVAGSGVQNPISSAQTVTPSSSQGSHSGGSFSVYSKSRNPFRTGFRISSSNASVNYTIHITRTSTIFDSVINAANGVDNMQWSTLRSIKYTAPSTLPTTKLAISFKADTESQGVIQNIKVSVQTAVPVYDSLHETWSVQNTSSPAWLAYWLMVTCPGIARNMPASRIYLPDWSDFDTFCQTKQFAFNAVLDSAQTLYEQVQSILAAGRGTLTRRDFGYGVVVDDTQTVPVDFFTSFTMSNFTATRSYVKLPHAIRCNFVNPEANWQQDQMIVLADGYAWNYGSGSVDCFGNATSVLPIATIFEEMDVVGVTTPRQVYEYCRYQLNVAYYRATTYTGDIDVQSLRVTRGDLVEVNHDVIAAGLGAGRVNIAFPDNETIQINEIINYPVGTGLACQIRTNAGGTFTVPVTPVDPTNSGQTNQFIFTNGIGTPAVPPLAVSPGDLVMIGIAGSVTRALLVTGIASAVDFAATLTMVDTPAKVWNSDNVTMPPFVSTITHVPWEVPPDPPTNLVIVSSGNYSSNDGGVSSPVGMLTINRVSGPVQLNAKNRAEIQ